MRLPVATPTAHRRSRRPLVGWSLATVYLVWGSTYLALRYGLEGFPPFLMNALRLVIAGALLYPIALRRVGTHPSWVQWRNAALTGGILFIGGLGFVTIAEDHGVGSGLVASAVAVIPMWAALMNGFFGEWPSRLEWAGLVIGLTGVVLLSREGDFRASTAGTVLMLLSPILWSFGSVLSTRVRLPRGLMASATQMIGGGLAMGVVGLVRGEEFRAGVPVRAWLALAYLILFGSFLAYTAYAYLLAVTRPAVATSYAFVNPVVAVFLGVTLGDEVIGGWTFAGLPVILLGVGLVGLAQSRRTPAARG